MIFEDIIKCWCGLVHVYGVVLVRFEVFPLVTRVYSVEKVAKRIDL